MGKLTTCCVLLFGAAVAVNAISQGWGPPPSFGSSSKGSGKPLRGSQVYLQDPWLHEHDYSKGFHGGPHKHHGWGGGSSGHSSGPLKFPESATYVQRLWPVLQFGDSFKKHLHSLHSLKPKGFGSKWEAPAVGLFGWDGTPHHVGLKNGHDQHGGQYENDGWSYNHGSHHIGHKVPDKTHYNTW